MNTSELISAWYYEFYVRDSKFNKIHNGIEFLTFKIYAKENNYDIALAIEKLKQNYYNKM